MRVSRSLAETLTLQPRLWAGRNESGTLLGPFLLFQWALVVSQMPYITVSLQCLRFPPWMLTWEIVPYKFRGLETIGIIVFLFNIALYITIWCILLLRFYLHPYTFRLSLTHPTESLFVPASIVSFGTILINISQYGPEATGPWLSYAVGVLFWIDAALAVIFSAGIYLLLYVAFLFLIK
jgi:tellurite resistance protein TehA-like permease